MHRGGRIGEMEGSVPWLWFSGCHTDEQALPSTVAVVETGLRLQSPHHWASEGKGWQQHCAWPPTAAGLHHQLQGSRQQWYRAYNTSFPPTAHPPATMELAESHTHPFNPDSDTHKCCKHSILASRSSSTNNPETQTTMERTPATPLIEVLESAGWPSNITRVSSSKRN